jgi:hypothetical protein
VRWPSLSTWPSSSTWPSGQAIAVARRPGSLRDRDQERAHGNRPASLALALQALPAERVGSLVSGGGAQLAHRRGGSLVHAHGMTIPHGRPGRLDAEDVATISRQRIAREGP